jgi:hypothetical protein
VSLTFALIEAQWAVINTVLLIILAAVNIYRGRKTNQKMNLISQHAADAKNKCGANRREEDKEFIEIVKEGLPTAPPEQREPKRFTDIEH